MWGHLQTQGTRPELGWVRRPERSTYLAWVYVDPVPTNPRFHPDMVRPVHDPAARIPEHLEHTHQKHAVLATTAPPGFQHLRHSDVASAARTQQSHARRTGSATHARIGRRKKTKKKSRNHDEGGAPQTNSRGTSRSAPPGPIAAQRSKILKYHGPHVRTRKNGLCGRARE